MQGAVRDDPSHASGSGRTLVFASTTNAANAVAELLAQSHLEVVIYHRNIPVADQVGPPAGPNSSIKLYPASLAHVCCQVWSILRIHPVGHSQSRSCPGSQRHHPRGCFWSIQWPRPLWPLVALLCTSSS